jgi:hypothetical protein
MRFFGAVMQDREYGGSAVTAPVATRAQVVFLAAVDWCGDMTFPLRDVTRAG